MTITLRQERALRKRARLALETAVKALGDLGLEVADKSTPKFKHIYAAFLSASDAVVELRKA